MSLDRILAVEHGVRARALRNVPSTLRREMSAEARLRSRGTFQPARCKARAAP